MKIAQKACTRHRQPRRQSLGLELQLALRNSISSKRLSRATSSAPGRSTASLASTTRRRSISVTRASCSGNSQLVSSAPQAPSSRVEIREGAIVPDLIVHRVGKRQNLFVVEVKKATNNDFDGDI